MGAGSSKSGCLTASSGQNSRHRPPGFQRIGDNFTELSQVQAALRSAGLESSSLIVAIDYTKSNQWTGKHSFGGRCLHAISATELNPYQQVISIIAKTLSAFDDDGLIPCYGFGDASTGDRRVFSFKESDQPCVGLEEVEALYQAITPQVKLAGPTSFAAAIYQAMKIVADSGNQYHILLLVADGQVSRAPDARPGELSVQEQDTIDAIVAASSLPLSIVMIGVGDGPWDTMRQFDDMLPTRKFDNFQFVNATDTFRRFRPEQRSCMEATFARDALMEIPEQYKTLHLMRLIGRDRRLNISIKPPLPPPVTVKPHSSAQPSPLTQSGATQKSDPVTLANSISGVSLAASRGAGPGQMSVQGSSGSGQDPDALYVCPITQELMQDPVLAADGYTYDRNAIEKWLQVHNTSPMTNERLPHKNLTPNHALRSSILEYKATLAPRSNAI